MLVGPSRTSLALRVEGSLLLHFIPSERFLVFLVLTATLVVLCALAVPVLITWINRRAEIRIVDRASGRTTDLRILIHRHNDERQRLSFPALSALVRRGRHKVSATSLLRRDTSEPD